MGRTVRAVLAYGYDLGGMDNFKAVERGEWGAPELPWWGEGDFTEAAGELLLKRIAGFEEEWTPEATGFFDRERAARKRVGVRFDHPGHVETPGLALIARDSDLRVGWSETMILDPNAIMAARPDWDAKLAAALDVLGIHPIQPAPRWLVYPTYG